MRQQIVLSLNGYKQAMLIIAETFKNWKVWKVRFHDGKEAVLFKCGNIWMQRNEDNLDQKLVNIIGEWIDYINWDIRLA